MSKALRRQDQILRLYEDEEIGRNPSSEKLAKRFNVGAKTIEQDLRALRRFMRSEIYEGEKEPIRDIRDAAGHNLSKPTEDSNNWKDAINS